MVEPGEKEKGWNKREGGCQPVRRGRQQVVGVRHAVLDGEVGALCAGVHAGEPLLRQHCVSVSHTAAATTAATCIDTLLLLLLLLLLQLLLLLLLCCVVCLWIAF